MRLTTWNCHHGTIAERVEDLVPLAPDLITLQECRKPLRKFPSVLWSGNPPRKGVAVVARDPALRLERLRMKVAPTTLPVVVHSPDPFLFVALWSLPPYEKFAVAAIRACDRARAGLPMIVMGDLNIPAKFDAFRIFWEELGLVSAYHTFHNIEAGAELHPTHYWRFHESAPWHIDFCLIPERWREKVREVRVAGFGEFSRSDHRPVTIDLGYGVNDPSSRNHWS